MSIPELVIKAETSGAQNVGCDQSTGLDEIDATNVWSTQINILAPAEADVPEILGLIRGLAEYENLEYLMTATEQSLYAALFGPSPIAEVLLAFCAGKIAGFALFFPPYCSVLGRRGLFLDNLYVQPEFRRKGVGDALLRRLATIATQRSSARLEWMVLDWNQPAINFYESKGAEFMNGWTKCRMDEGSIKGLSQTTFL